MVIIIAINVIVVVIIIFIYSSNNLSMYEIVFVGIKNIIFRNLLSAFTEMCSTDD